MDELTRFARRLVEQLGASSEGVHRPVEVAALRETVLPYRTHRKALGVDSVEDYETLVLRLVAGERGYVRTVPAEAAQRCREELASANPDLAVLDEVAGATVQITSMAAAQIVDDGADRADRADRADSEVRAEKADKQGRPGKPGKTGKAEGRETLPAVPDVPAPPAITAPPAVPAPPIPAVPAVSAPPALSDACPHCKHPIPADRQVVFCPWCGKRLIPFTCSRCNTELDSEWKHCITCGAPAKDPFGYP